MFDDTIKNNVMLYEDYKVEDLKKALEMSRLDKFIEKLNLKEDYQVGENGCNLSGGERQRIAIARALIKETPILLMDEATSSIDNQNAFEIESMITNIQNLTCIVITHKIDLSILEKFDQIITLKDGKIEEIGHYDELLSNKGYFYSLANQNGMAGNFDLEVDLC
jgi:ATP-binding cassette subfamily C protein